MDIQAQLVYSYAARLWRSFKIISREMGIGLTQQVVILFHFGSEGIPVSIGS